MRPALLENSRKTECGVKQFRVGGVVRAAPFALVVAAAVLASAETPKLKEPYLSLVELAHAAPPEFAADALLRIAESGKISDRDARRDLLEDAFRLAAEAKFPVRMRGLPGTVTDTRSGFLSQAYSLKLDSVSLRSRAVTDMLRIDASAARRLFQEIPPLSLAPLTCDDALFYDVADFYQALAAVVNGAFTSQERSKEEHMNLLLNYIGQVISPAQLLPLAHAIQGAGVTSEQKEILWIRFNAMLPNIPSDGRSFSALLVDAGQEPELLAILKTSVLKSIGCKDDAGQDGVTPGGEKLPAGSGPTPKIERYWQSPEAKKLFADGKKLRVTANGKLLSDADRATPEWQQQLEDYLSALAAWGPAPEESEADYYNEKCLIYIALVELIPAGPQRDRTLETFVNFIGNSGLQSESPVEWFQQARTMLERMRPDNAGEPAKVLDAFERSGNAVLVLETALERALGAQAPSWAISAK